MVAPQELMVIRDHSHMIKGKRTKRQRPISQISLTMATSSCSSAEVSGGGFGGAAKDEEEEEEEEYLANCLILLAKGKTQKLCEQLPAVTRSNVYQCKTCNRCFPSFQALGGHRASHNKPKTRTLEEHVLQISDDHGTNLSLQISKCRGLCSPENNKSRVHECSICGAEFTSGQALGGHMRRHRPMPYNHDQHSLKAKKSRNLLSLDLNLPAAPEDNDDDDHREYSKFSFASEEQVLSASPLVDCHL